MNELVSLTQEQAENVWQILVEECGALAGEDSASRYLFLRNAIIPQRYHEIRFLQGTSFKITGRSIRTITGYTALWAVMYAIADANDISIAGASRANKRIKEFLTNN